MAQDNPIIKFAERIENSTTRDAFLGLMVVTIVGGDVVGLARDFNVDDNHEVWPYIEQFVEQEYGLSWSELSKRFKETER